ncbi:Hypothetical protein SMAX5B_000658 [Scophthalmus maximus]|uniref:Uncharacterized protein n=1 Tax=Scophthalmus maximus TaxID=52904 RepID=A0A2U9B6B8_SCOMX|nr:Hypothetical protein SMAX5B_000658 [Scophthalmus maximus]
MLSLPRKQFCANIIIVIDLNLPDTKWKCSNAPLLLTTARGRGDVGRSWLRGARPLLRTTSEREEVKLSGWKRKVESGNEDCFRQALRGPERYNSPEGCREKQNRRTDENVENYKQEDVDAQEASGQTRSYKTSPSVRGQMVSGPVPGPGGW